MLARTRNCSVPSTFGESGFPSTQLSKQSKPRSNFSPLIPSVKKHPRIFRKQITAAAFFYLLLTTPVRNQMFRPIDRQQVSRNDPTKSATQAIRTYVHSRPNIGPLGQNFLQDSLSLLCPPVVWCVVPICGGPAAAPS